MNFDLCLDLSDSRSTLNRATINLFFVVSAWVGCNVESAISTLKKLS